MRMRKCLPFDMPNLRLSYPNTLLPAMNKMKSIRMHMSANGESGARNKYYQHEVMWM